MTEDVEVILSSRNVADPDPDRKITTLRLRYPRCIHAEFMTHRAFSRNAASSRAIPVERMIQSVIDDPFVPRYWGRNQRGMTAIEECDEPVRQGIYGFASRETVWLDARDDAVTRAKAFAKAGYHKQIVNRLLEPFSHITVVVTATEWKNFSALRDHADAEPHIRALAVAIREAMAVAPVQELQPGDWHLPFTDTQMEDDGMQSHRERLGEFGVRYIDIELAKKLSVARCASTSYKTVEGFDMTLERAVILYDKLRESQPPHLSPFEHQAEADIWAGFKVGRWDHPHLHRNFTGWNQYRALIEEKLF